MQSDSVLKSGNLESPIRHEKYYWMEGLIYLVENTLFKVPRHMLEIHSPIFSDMFKLGGTVNILEGLHDNNPIHLPQTSAVDFARMLTILYPLITSEGPDSAHWSEIEWTSVLKLAVMWDMIIIRAIAVQNIDKLGSPALKINLGRQFDHEVWVIDGFFTLILRTEPMTEVEARELDLKDVIGCAAVREKVRGKLMELGSHTRVNIPTRYGNVVIRSGEYPDGMFLKTHAWVRMLIEDTFGIKTPG